MNLFECKIQHDKQLENGMIKKVTDAYLVDALSFTEAEARIIQEVTPYLSGEFSVENIKRLRIVETFEDESSDRWYIAKVSFLTINEKTAEEKRTNCQMLMQASSFREAYDRLVDGMKSSMADYEIVSIKETPYIELFKYKVQETQE